MVQMLLRSLVMSTCVVARLGQCLASCDLYSILSLPLPLSWPWPLALPLPLPLPLPLSLATLSLHSTHRAVIRMTARVHDLVLIDGSGKPEHAEASGP